MMIPFTVMSLSLRTDFLAGELFALYIQTIYIITLFLILNLHDVICRFVELEISFPVKNMRVIHPEKVECYLFKVSVSH